MEIKTVNPSTNNNTKSFEEMIGEEVDAANQISNQAKKSPASSQDKSSNEIEDIKNQEIEATFQRRPQFKLNENNRRRFF